VAITFKDYRIGHIGDIYWELLPEKNQSNQIEERIWMVHVDYWQLDFIERVCDWMILHHQILFCEAIHKLIVKIL
jgi:hypothetical protein